MKSTLFYSLFLFVCFPLVLPAQWQPTNGPDGGAVYCLERVGTQVWAGTRGGLYVSDDEGETWYSSPFVSESDEVYTIATFPDEILMAVNEYDDTSNQYHPSTYRSTDGGLSWTKHIDPSYNMAPKRCKYFRAGNKLYLQGDIYLFVSVDNGQQWTKITGPFNVSPRDWSVSGDSVVVSTNQGFYTSVDGGNIWSAPINSGNSYDHIFFDGYLIIVENVLGNVLAISQDFGLTWANSPNPAIDPQTIFRGDNGQLYTCYHGIYQSEDNGMTWTRLFSSGNISTLQSGRDAICSGLEFLIASASSGLYKTINKGDAWVISHTGLRAANIFDLQSDTYNRLFAITDNYLVRSMDLGVHWEKLPFTLGYAKGMLVKGDTLFVCTGNHLYHSLDNGNTWSDMSSQNISVRGRMTWHRNALYFGSNDGILKTANLGLSWSTLTFNVPNLHWPETTEDLLSDGNNLYAFTHGGDILRSTNDGQTWTLVHSIYSPFAYSGNKLFKLNNRLFAFGENESCYSDDQGSTWTPFAGTGLPTNQAGDLLQIQSVAGWQHYILATLPQHGVYISNDSGASWHAMQDGLEHSSGPLVFADDQLFFGTNTSGVWKHELPFASGTNNAQSETNPYFFPNPATDVLAIQSPNNALLGQMASVHLMDQTGRILMAVQTQLEESPVRLTLPRLVTGIYLLELTSGTSRFVKEIAIFQQ